MWVGSVPEIILMAVGGLLFFKIITITVGVLLLTFLPNEYVLMKNSFFDIFPDGDKFCPVWTKLIS